MGNLIEKEEMKKKNEAKGKTGDEVASGEKKVGEEVSRRKTSLLPRVIPTRKRMRRISHIRQSIPKDDLSTLHPTPTISYLVHHVLHTYNSHHYGMILPNQNARRQNVNIERHTD